MGKRQPEPQRDPLSRGAVNIIDAELPPCRKQANPMHANSSKGTRYLLNYINEIKTHAAPTVHIS